MKVVIIDNYDSFTYNLFQQFGRISREKPIVFRNDEMTVEQIADLSPSHVVLSPGPGHPAVERDFGVCRKAITDLGKTIPLLGVCLGHQGIVHTFGGQVIRAPEIVHGKTSRISHSGAGLFAGLPESLEVMRYHSLIAERASLPACLEATAETKDGLIMAVRHRELPIVGVQFHPESIGTPDGDRLIKNFLEM